MSRSRGLCLATCLALVVPAFAADGPKQPPYSWRGINGSGVFPAGDLVTTFLSWGCSGATCWGNRILIRSNDYLWCIGDPKAAWRPPEKYLK